MPLPTGMISPSRLTDFAASMLMSRANILNRQRSPLMLLVAASLSVVTMEIPSRHYDYHDGEHANKHIILISPTTATVRISTA